MSGDLKWAIENGDLDKVKDFIDNQVCCMIKIKLLKGDCEIVLHH